VGPIDLTPELLELPLAAGQLGLDTDGQRAIRGSGTHGTTFPGDARGYRRGLSSCLNRRGRL
jgi:hypothetical protein